jgi:hypothetical protein
MPAIMLLHCSRIRATPPAMYNCWPVDRISRPRRTVSAGFWSRKLGYPQRIAEVKARFVGSAFRATGSWLYFTELR